MTKLPLAALALSLAAPCWASPQIAGPEKPSAPALPAVPAPSAALPASPAEAAMPPQEAAVQRTDATTADLARMAAADAGSVELQARAFDHGPLRGEPLSVMADRSIAAPQYNQPGFPEMHWRNLSVNGNAWDLARYKRAHDAVIEKARGRKDIWGIFSLPKPWYGSQETTLYGSKAAVDEVAAQLRQAAVTINAQESRWRSNAFADVFSVGMTLGLGLILMLLLSK